MSLLSSLVTTLFFLAETYLYPEELKPVIPQPGKFNSSFLPRIAVKRSLNLVIYFLLCLTLGHLFFGLRGNFCLLLRQAHRKSLIKDEESLISNPLPFLTASSRSFSPRWFCFVSKLSFSLAVGDPQGSIMLPGLFLSNTSFLYGQMTHECFSLCGTAI